jgi:hypothetical protein
MDDEFWEPWKPQWHDRVHVKVTPECPTAEGNCIDDIGVVVFDEYPSKTGHTYGVQSDTGGGIGVFAAIELEFIEHID